MKKNIAILGDSLTFSYLPMGTGKMADADNWPVKLENLLTKYYQTREIEIQTDAQPGRTIIKPLIDFGFPKIMEWIIYQFYIKKHIQLICLWFFRNKWLFWLWCLCKIKRNSRLSN
ncbi:hypothetical protein [Spiroplasma sp. ChiS]|uniref:hypothetical protein n=1 Tax=Spiroplasma sp. ChiS TaxID=2099885 RepID=UPI001F2D7757|nr:hypothetical protein [Spiroplasma sp. ChiS]